MLIRLIVFLAISGTIAPLHAQYLIRSLGFGKLTSAAISPDGAKLATGAVDGGIRLWDCATGKLLKTFRTRPPTVVIRPGSLGNVTLPMEVRSLSFSRSGDTLLAGSGNRTIQFWKVSTGEMIDDLYIYVGDADWTDTDSPISIASYTANGNVLAARSTMLYYYYGNSDSTKYGFSYPGQITAFALSPDGDKVAIGGDGKVLNLVDIEPRSSIRSFPAGKTNAVAFMPDSPIGMRILAAGKGIRLWDAVKDSVRMTYGDTSEILSMVLSADGSRILSSLGNTAVIYDAATGRKTMTFSGHDDKVFSLGFSSDEKRIFTVSRDNTVRLWDVSTGKVLQVFRGHTSNPKSMAFSSDGKKLASVSHMTAVLWDVKTGDSLRTFLGHAGQVQSVALSADASMVLTGSMDSTACLWNASTGNPLRKFQGHAGAVNAVALSPDGNTVFTGSADSTAKLWDANTGAVLRTLSPDTADAIHCANFSSDGGKIIVGSMNGRIYIWNTGDGSLTKAIKARDDSSADVYRDHTDTVFSASFYPGNDSFFVSVYYPPNMGYSLDYPRIAIGNLKTDSVRWYKETYDLRASAVAPDGKSYLFSRYNGIVLLKSPDDPHPTYIEKEKSASRIAFNPAENMAAFVKYDGRIQLWSLSGSASIGKPFGAGARGPGLRFVGRKGGTLLFKPASGIPAFDPPTLVIAGVDGKVVCQCPLMSKAQDAYLAYRLPVRLGEGNYLCYFPGTPDSRFPAIRIRP